MPDLRRPLSGNWRSAAAGPHRDVPRDKTTTSRLEGSLQCRSSSQRTNGLVLSQCVQRMRELAQHALRGGFDCGAVRRAGRRRRPARAAAPASRARSGRTRRQTQRDPTCRANCSRASRIGRCASPGPYCSMQRPCASHRSVPDWPSTKVLHQRGLADAGLARDEHELPAPCVRSRQCALQSAEVGFAADQPLARVHRTGRATARSERRDEAKAQAVHRLHVAWRRRAIVERNPQLVNGARQGSIGDDHSGPHRPKELVLRNKLTCAPQQRHQHAQGLARYRDDLPVANQSTLTRVEVDRPETPALDLPHDPFSVSDRWSPTGCVQALRPARTLDVSERYQDSLRVSSSFALAIGVSMSVRSPATTRLARGPGRVATSTWNVPWTS